MQLFSKLSIDFESISNAVIGIVNEICNSKKLATATLFGTFAIILSTYYYLKWRRMCTYFQKLNIPGPKPKPLVGDFMKLISMGITNYDEYVISKYGKILGYFDGTVPNVLCADPDMVKHVMIKDSQYFMNRRIIEGIYIDPMDKFLNNLKGEEWKNARAIVSTTFTSGKLKEMFSTMEPCIDILVNHFGKVAKSGGTFNAKECYQKMTFDIMASCCFGVQTDSINNPDDLILKHLKCLLEQQLTVKVLLAIIFPKLMLNIFKTGLVSHMPKDTIKFFVELTEMTINRRRNKEQYRNDFIQIMVDHEEKLNDQNSNGEKKTADLDGVDEKNVHWKYLKRSLTNREILAQAILFLFAGSETSATTLGYVSLLLAKNPEIQRKLQAEIDRVYKEHNEVNYEMLHEIEYLDMVVDETLRLFPAALRTDRECNADYHYKGMKIPKGTIWSVSIWVMHHDPNIYPEPFKFDPERFSAEGRKTRDSCTYIPFGAGPRNCVGMRFALMTIKLLLVKFLLKYNFVVCDETPCKIEMDNSGLAKSKVPIILKVEERTA